MLELSFFMVLTKNSRLTHFNTVNQIFRYFPESPNKGIILKSNEKFKLIKYTNSDWVRDYTDWKLMSRFIFILNRKLINYASKKQAIDALS